MREADSAACFLQVGLGAVTEERLAVEQTMKTMKYTYWQDGEFYIGYLNDFPAYETEAKSKEELVENLNSLLLDMESGDVPYIRHTDELLIA